MMKYLRVGIPHVCIVFLYASTVPQNTVAEAAMTFSLSIFAICSGPAKRFSGCIQGRQVDAVEFATLVFACLIAILGLILNSSATLYRRHADIAVDGTDPVVRISAELADCTLGKKAERNVAPCHRKWKAA